MKKVIVLGGGIGGLTSTFRLLKKADVHLYEASNRLGGIIQTIQKDNFLMELGPDCFISENPSGIQLAKDLGLESELIGTIPTYRQSFIVKKNKLIPVPNDFYLMAPRAFWPFALSPILTWSGKFRALLDLFIPARKDSSDESLADFVTRRLGKELLDRVAQPMIAGIYTADPKNLSLQATMPRFLEWEKNYGSIIKGLRRQKGNQGTSGPRYSLFISFKNGMKTFTNELIRQIPAEKTHLNMKAERIERAQNQWKVYFSNNQEAVADEIIFSLPAHTLSKLLKSTSETLSQKVSSIPYASSGTVNFVFKENQIQNKMNGAGFVIPSIEPRSLMAASFVHHKFEGRCPKGFSMIRAFIGGAMNENILHQEDDFIVNAVYKDLQELLGIRGDPVHTHLHRWWNSMPQYTIGHLDRVTEIENEVAKYPGLHLVGNAYRGVGIPGSISSAEKCVSKI